MNRITVRLNSQQHAVLLALAQELGTDISGAIRALISSHQRTAQLLNAFDTAKRDILAAVAASRAANSENLKRVFQSLTTSRN